MKRNDTYGVKPFTEPVNGACVTPPGSKSITNRALVFAALNHDAITLENALFSRDTRIMVACLRQLGIEIVTDESQKRIQVNGCDGTIPIREARLNVGNAGTAARFLTALICLHEGGYYYIDGDEEMRKRPMSGLLNALEEAGAARVKYHGVTGHMPYSVQTQGLKGGEIQLDASASSQMLSALLMIAPFAKSPVSIKLKSKTVSQPFVNMTQQMMQFFGYSQFREHQNGLIYTCQPVDRPYYACMPISPNVYRIEPDATAASYFLVLPIAAGGHIEVTLPANSLQGDTGFATVLNTHWKNCRRLTGIISVKVPSQHPPLPGIEADFNAISDTFLTIAAIAPLLNGPTTITGIGHTRHQETDRIAAMAKELQKLGQGVEEGADWLRITPRPLQPATIETYNDHRIAMSFAILGCTNLNRDGSSWLALKNPECCEKTFPEFFDKLEALREANHS